MPTIIFTKPLSDEERRILARFEADILRLANDMNSNAKIISIGREKGSDYVITQLGKVFDDAEQRLNAMSESLTWQAYQLGVTQAIMDTSDILTWNLDENAEHCDTCLEYAAIRYFTPETFPGIPGNAPTECGAGCRCFIT